MKEWLNQYRLCLRKTWLISLVGFLIVIGLVVREFYAIYVGISMYERPSLPNEIWWEVFYAALVATTIAILLTVRVFVLRRYGYSLIVFLLTVLTILGFIGYAYLSPPASADSICDDSGRCFGFYVLERQDWVDAAAIIFFPGTLLRSVLTAVAAVITSRSKLK